tara:strand:+ start:296 stop:799 length:504 start_codon:yes stop_codon:yes gene_type:complete
MPHEPGHTNGNNISYKIAGTDVSYSGKVIMIAGEPFSTDGGGIEGTSQRLEQLRGNRTNQNVIKDVITPFEVGDGSTFGNGNYFYSNGNVVPANTKLHHHTITPIGRTSNFMTQHTMDGNEQDVFVRNNGGMQTSTSGTRTQTSTRRTSGTRTRTSGGSMGGGRSGY